MIVAGYGNHGGIVRSELELRQVRVPATLLALLLDTVSQSAVRRYAASDRYLLDTGLLGSLYQFIQQYVYQCFLETCTDVFLVLLHELRILGHLIPHEIKQGCLDTAETVVQTWNMRLGELEPVGVA